MRIFRVYRIPITALKLKWVTAWQACTALHAMRMHENVSHALDKIDTSNQLMECDISNRNEVTRTPTES